MARDILVTPQHIRDSWVGGRSSDGFTVPPDGGYLVQEDWLGRREMWIAWTNYPSPYRNEWSMIRQSLDGDYLELAIITLWWYGEWI